MAELCVKPYCCVMSNMTGHFQGNHYVARSFNIVRDRLRALGYRVSRVRSLWSPNGDFIKVVLVEFGGSEADCESAFKLQRMFEFRNHGRANWLSSNNLGNDPYLWVATTRDSRLFRGRADYAKVPLALKESGEPVADADI